MRKRAILLSAVMIFGLQADLAQAQFSPRQFLGRFERPLRQMLGRLGHLPHSGAHRRVLRPRSIAEASRAATSQPTRSAPELGNTGPTGWPTAFEDVLGYTFWPNDYAAMVRGRGFEVIAMPLTASLPASATARASASAVQNDSTGALPKNGCEATENKDNWPAAKIEQTVGHLSDAQRDALNKMQAALTQSLKAIEASCNDLSASSPLERLDATVQLLWAVRDAGIFARGTLAAFYDTLTDEQKSKLRWQQQQNPAAREPDNKKASDQAATRQYQLCATPSLEAAERLMKQIDQEVRPGKAQNASLQALRKAASDTAKLLTAPCAQPIPADPVARLDGISNQLSAMSYAATTLLVALNAFHAQLDDGQKAKFDSLGR